MQQRVEEKRENLITLYKQGKSVQQLTELLGMSKTTVRKVIRSAGLEIRSQSDQQLIMNGSSSLKHWAFDTLTEEALYWIGFIYADGYVHKKQNRSLITIDLSTEDRNHLEKFKKFLDAGVSIRDNKRHRLDKVYYTSIITISSKPLFDRLTELGFTNDKTYTAVVHPDLINHVAFWRGVFDGDGWISRTHTRKYQYPWVGLCGTYDTVQSFIEFVKSNGVLTDVIKARHKKGTKNNFETAFVNNVGLNILDLLYKDATVYLDRKYAVYQQLLNNNNT